MDRDQRSQSQDSSEYHKKHRISHREKQQPKERKKKRKHSRSRSSSSSDSDSKNFKFESKIAHKNNHKKKKKYKRDRKSSRSSRSSRSSKSADRKELMKENGYRQRSRSRERVDKRPKPKTGPASRPKFKINCSFLSDLIIDQKINNKKLDEQQIASTGEKLQKNFKVNSKPVAMSQYLCNQGLRVNISKIQNKIYTCELQKCKKRFDKIQEFQKHIQEHKQVLTR